MSVKVRVPLVAPAVVGVKVTETVQLPPGATDVQVEDDTPNGELVTTEAIFKVWFPVLVTVTDSGAEVAPTFVAGKARLEALKEMAGPAALPVPDKPTDWCDPGLLPASSARTIDPVTVPTAVGEKSTVN